MGKNIAIITAGGSGSRFGSSARKQYIRLAERPLLFWTIDNFLQYNMIDQILVALPPDDLSDLETLLKTEFHNDKIRCLAGGEERQYSVFNALSHCTADTDFVFIHDGVRPFISLEEIKKLHQKAQLVDSVIPAYPVRNTIKQISGEKIEKTLIRRNLIAALTPQVFRFKLIWECHQKARQQDLLFTDDAALLEHYGHPVYWLECSSRNIKITEPLDLQIAEIILKNQNGF